MGSRCHRPTLSFAHRFVATRGATPAPKSRAIALALLFFGGLALGRYAGYSSWKLGFMMVGIGTALLWAILALGG